MWSEEVTEITAPSTEPITLAEMQAHGYIDTIDPARVNLIEDIYIPAARQYLEDRTGRTFHQKTLEWLFSEFPSGTDGPMILRRATPLISITSIKYKDENGTETTWGASNYIADTDSRVGRVRLVYGGSWPSFTRYPFWPVRVRGVAGIATASPITEAPAAAKYALCLLVAAMWENREGETIPERGTTDTICLKYGIEAYIGHLQREYEF